MKKAIYANKGLVAVRYPRGAEDVAFNKDYISTDHIFMHVENADTLIITYGRLYNEVYKAQSLLEEKGISCDILKMTRIFPIAHDIIREIKKYKRIVFFEEAERQGGISAQFGDLLMEEHYDGDYSRITADGFIKQASVKSALRKLGMTSEKMADYVCRRSMKDGEA